MQKLNPGDLEKRLKFGTNFLGRIFVDNEWPWNILWSNETHFTLDGAVNRQNCRYVVVHVLMLCMSVLCIQNTLLCGVVLQVIFFLVLFSLGRTLL